MVKVFTIKDEDGKITLTKEELEALLQEAYEEGRKSSQYYYQIPTIPSYDYKFLETPPYNYRPDITCSVNK